MRVLARKIFTVIFIIHILWFLFFLFQKFNEENFTVENLRTKVWIMLFSTAAIAIIYYFLLRKIKQVHNFAVFIWKLGLKAYTFFLFYLLYCTFFNPPITITQIVSVLQGYGLKRDYVCRADLGPNVKLAVIASEDQLFPDHDGFDLKAIKKAIKYNKRHPNRPPRGASTISQQVAKNIFLWQGGGFFRKGLEVFFTFTIENVWSKETILARYLNIAETGKGIFGAEAAAQAYFKKSVKSLSRMEAATIAAYLPNPKLLSSKNMSGRAASIVSQMNNLDGDTDVAEIIR